MHRYIRKISVAALQKIGIAVLILSGLLLLAGCERKVSGPAEHAGKEIDEATVAVGKQVEKAGISIQDAGKGDKP